MEQVLFLNGKRYSARHNRRKRDPRSGSFVWIYENKPSGSKFLGRRYIYGNLDNAKFRSIIKGMGKAKERK